MVQAYYKRLTHSNEAVRLSAAVQFLCWEDTLSRIAEYNPRYSSCTRLLLTVGTAAHTIALQCDTSRAARQHPAS